MIYPTVNDIGRKVVYRTKFVMEEGVITSFNEKYVFVRYGTDVHSKGTRREDLDWVEWIKKDRHDA